MLHDDVALSMFSKLVGIIDGAVLDAFGLWIVIAVAEGGPVVASSIIGCVTTPVVSKYTK